MNTNFVFGLHSHHLDYICHTFHIVSLHTYRSPFPVLQVIFSQSSELLERQSSMASSTECVSGPGNDVSTEQSKHDTTDTEQRFGLYMKDFDFLEYELESLEGESVDNFNWGVRRPSLSNLEQGYSFSNENYSEKCSTLHRHPTPPYSTKCVG